MMLVVGVGQPLAGDDGVGPAVARRLRAGGVAAEVVADGAGLLGLLEATGARQVVVVDAVAGAGPPGAVLVLAPDELRGERPVSSHGLSVGDALALARALYGKTDVRIVAVSIATPTARGEGLSPPVAAAVEKAADRVLAELAGAR